MNSIDEARQYFSQDKFATDATDIVIEDCRENYSKCSFKVCDKHKNAVGSVMGGAIYTLADFSFAVASNYSGIPTVTTTSNISFLSAPKGDTLIAECTAIKEGRRMCFYNIRVTDNLDTLVATVSVSGMHLG